MSGKVSSATLVGMVWVLAKERYDSRIDQSHSLRGNDHVPIRKERIARRVQHMETLRQTDNYCRMCFVRNRPARR